MKGQLQRTLMLIAIVVGSAAAIALFSRILLTLDELQTPEIRIAYAAGVVAILATVGALLYRRFRPATPARRTTVTDRPTAESRLDRLYARHHLDASPPPVKPLRRLGRGDPATVALLGVARAGKSRLADALTAALPERIRSHPLRMIETPAIGTDFATNLEGLNPALTADVAVFVADQDLRDYEFAVVKAMSDRGNPPIVVLNKADQRDSTARAETYAAVSRRLAGIVAEPDIVEATADPLPLLEIRADVDGRTIEAETPRAPDVARAAARVLARLDPSTRS
jgi:Predicted GTPases